MNIVGENVEFYYRQGQYLADIFLKKAEINNEPDFLVRAERIYHLWHGNSVQDKIVGFTNRNQSEHNLSDSQKFTNFKSGFIEWISRKKPDAKFNELCFSASFEKIQKEWRKNDYNKLDQKDLKTTTEIAYKYYTENVEKILTIFKEKSELGDVFLQMVKKRKMDREFYLNVADFKDNKLAIKDRSRCGFCCQIVINLVRKLLSRDRNKIENQTKEAAVLVEEIDSVGNLPLQALKIKKISRPKGIKTQAQAPADIVPAAIAPATAIAPPAAPSIENIQPPKKTIEQ